MSYVNLSPCRLSSLILNNKIQQLQLGTFGAIKQTGTQAINAIGQTFVTLASGIKNAATIMLPFLAEFLASRHPYVVLESLHPSSRILINWERNHSRPI